MAKMTSKLTMALLFAIGLGHAWAAEPLAWSALERDEQALLAPYAERWDGLEPAQQQRLKRGAARWQQMDGSERAVARERFQRWQQLSPEQRAHIRDRFQQFRQLPAEQQQRIRERMEAFRTLPPERREALRAQWQALSDEERAALRARLKQRRMDSTEDETGAGISAGQGPMNERLQGPRMGGGGPMMGPSRR